MKFKLAACTGSFLCAGRSTTSHHLHLHLFLHLLFVVNKCASHPRLLSELVKSKASTGSDTNNVPPENYVVAATKQQHIVPSSPFDDNNNVDVERSTTSLPALHDDDEPLVRSLIGSTSTSTLLPSLPSTKYSKRRSTTARSAANEEMSTLNSYYIVVFVFMFFIVLVVIVSRVIYSNNEVPFNHAYLKYHRESIAAAALNSSVD